MSELSVYTGSPTLACVSVSGGPAEADLRDNGLLDRDQELRTLRGVVGDHGGVAVIRGAAGLGKSALLAAAAAYARERGFVVCSTAGVASEVSLPFAALERLLHGLLDRAETLPKPQRDALLSGFGLEETSVTDVFLVGLATLNLLADAASGTGLLLVVDDAQWLDPASADALGFVARRIEAEPIAMLVAQRDGGSPHALQAAIGEVAADLALTPLGDEAAWSVLERTATELPMPARRRLLAIAAGNPLALSELPLTAADRIPDAGDRVEVPLTRRLEQSFTAQEAHLAPTVRALLRVTAADDRDFLAEILAATRILAPDAGDPELEAASRAGLLEHRDGRLRFRHPLMRSAIYQAATSAQRRAAHTAIAQVTGEEPYRRAWHLAAATVGPDDVVAAELDAAAMDARRRGATALAARSLQRAAALSSVRQDAIPRMLAAAELSLELGDLDAVANLVAAAEQLDLDLRSRARIRFIRETFAQDGSQDETPIRALVTDAKLVRSDGDADLALKLLLAAATRCWWALPAEAPVREEVVAEALRGSTEEDDARVLAVLAATSAVHHAGLIIERLERACAIPDRDPEASHLLGQAAHMVGHSELAVRQLSRVEAEWRAQGRLAPLAQALIMRAWSSIQLGNWPAVDPAAEEGERLAHETAQPLWAAGARAARAAAAGARGESDRGMALASEVEAELVAARPTNIFAVLQVARGVTALGAGRYAEAYDHLARMFDPTDLAHHYAERHGGLSYLAEAAVQCDRLEEARAIVSAFEPLVQQTPATLLQVGASVARPLITSEDDDPEGAFEIALAAQTAALPFHRARLLLAYGAWLRRSRRPSDSRAPLRTARDLFDALGTVPWAERARQELRASGETSRRRAPEARDQLTPQELQIAQMAAIGLSNPEIGERLFLSARTVASHLYRAFPKLGIASRWELAAALGLSSESN
jgi:DNA-binding CsgD family transcriptional regulator